MAGACRSRQGEDCRERDDGSRDGATSQETSGFACSEEDDGNQGGSVEGQGPNREGEDSRPAQIEENGRQGKDWQGQDDGQEANDDEADAKNRAWLVPFEGVSQLVGQGPERRFGNSVWPGGVVAQLVLFVRAA